MMMMMDLPQGRPAARCNTEAACSLAGLVVGFFPRSSQTLKKKKGTLVATLSGAWLYRVSAGTGWPDVRRL